MTADCGHETCDPHFPDPENGDPTACDACCGRCGCTEGETGGELERESSGLSVSLDMKETEE